VSAGIDTWPFPEMVITWLVAVRGALYETDGSLYEGPVRRRSGGGANRVVEALGQPGVAVEQLVEAGHAGQPEHDLVGAGGGGRHQIVHDLRHRAVVRAARAGHRTLAQVHDRPHDEAEGVGVAAVALGPVTDRRPGRGQLVDR